MANLVKLCSPKPWWWLTSALNPDCPIVWSFVIDQVSLTYRLHVVWGIYLCLLYQYFHQSCYHNFLRGYRMIMLVFALCLHCTMMVSKRRNAKQQFPVLNCFTSCGRFEYWIEGVWVNDRVVVLGTHTVTRSCWLGHCRSAGQALPWLYDADL
jgi:hypothetical protein